MINAVKQSINTNSTMLCVIEPFICFMAGMMCCLAGSLIKDQIDENAHSERRIMSINNNYNEIKY